MVNTSTMMRQGAVAPEASTVSGRAKSFANGRIRHHTGLQATRKSQATLLRKRSGLRIACEAEDDSGNKGKSIDTAGAGGTFVSPDWLTALQRNWGGKSSVPVADAQVDDIKDLLGGALFLPLFKWMEESGPVYILPTGPITSFLVVSDPECAKYVLRDYANYKKGLVREVSEFLFGDGFAVAEGDLWKARRRSVGPSLHRKYLEVMVDRVFGDCSLRLNSKLAAAAESGTSIDVEALFSQLTLDIIGKSVFNYDFDSLTTDSPVIQAVYTALKETETRATDVLPIWRLPDPIRLLFPRQRKASEAVDVIRKCVDDLVAQCKAMVEAEEAKEVDEEYVNASDPSVLRFLLDSREEVSSSQLRDDLLSMLVAGHETTGSVLTWTAYLLATNREAYAKAKEEVDRVMGDALTPTFAQVKELAYLMRCINESMRLYPHPPVLLRRATNADELPGGFEVPAGQDVMISVYNIHRSPAVWGDDADEFKPERFGPLDGPTPNEQNTDFKYIPFSGGPRKCVGDQFALMEAVVALAVVIKSFDLELTPGQEIKMTTGATIHTQDGLYMNVTPRSVVPVAEPAAV